ncbi:MAG: pilus assembly protein N-terminal domain-containing protein [Cyanobacteria bacterium P01_H01_bin.74]
MMKFTCQSKLLLALSTSLSIAILPVFEASSFAQPAHPVHSATAFQPSLHLTMMSTLMTHRSSLVPISLKNQRQAKKLIARQKQQPKSLMFQKKPLSPVFLSTEKAGQSQVSSHNKTSRYKLSKRQTPNKNQWMNRQPKKNPVYPTIFATAPNPNRLKQKKSHSHKINPKILAGNTTFHSFQSNQPDFMNANFIKPIFIKQVYLKQLYLKQLFQPKTQKIAAIQTTQKTVSQDLATDNPLPLEETKPAQKTVPLTTIISRPRKTVPQSEQSTPQKLLPLVPTQIANKSPQVPGQDVPIALLSQIAEVNSQANNTQPKQKTLKREEILQLLAMTEGAANQSLNTAVPELTETLQNMLKGIDYTTYSPVNQAPQLSVRGNYTTDGILRSGIKQKVMGIQLPVGKARIVELNQPAQRVSISNPEVASAVIISGTQIQLIGKSVGVCNLLVWSDIQSSEYSVVDVAVHHDVSVLVNQLHYVDPGIELVPIAAEDSVILTGRAKNRESAQLAVEIAKAFFSNYGNGGGGLNDDINSQAPGSAVPGSSTNVINLIKVDGEPSTKLELVRNKLLEIDPNVNIDVVPGPDNTEKVILTGRVRSASIASKALNLASVFYGQPGLKLITAQGGNEFSRLQGVNAASSSTSGGSGGSTGGLTGGVNILHGSVMTDATGNVISMLEIEQKPQIRCSIKFLELNKSTLKALGSSLSGVRGSTKLANWSGVQSPAPGRSISSLSSENPAGSDFSTVSTRDGTGNGWVSNAQSFGQNFNEVYQNGVTQVFTINNTIAGAIQALQENSKARLLAEPTLTLLSGEQGSFLAGGEVPIAFVGGNGQISIEYHEFGIRLNLLPTVTDDGKIQMQVSPEVSSVDQSNGVSTPSVTVPAFLTRRVNTTLLVRPGESFILSGLYNQDDTSSLSRFPVLGSLPVVGNFFRNRWKNRTTSEMIVIVRPEILYTETGDTTAFGNQNRPGRLSYDGSQNRIPLDADAEEEAARLYKKGDDASETASN